MEEAAAASPTAPAAATAAAVAAAVAADVTPGDEEIPLQGMGIGWDGDIPNWKRQKKESIR